MDYWHNFIEAFKKRLRECATVSEAKLSTTTIEILSGGDKFHIEDGKDFISVYISIYHIRISDEGGSTKFISHKAEIRLDKKHSIDSNIDLVLKVESREGVELIKDYTSLISSARSCKYLIQPHSRIVYNFNNDISLETLVGIASFGIIYGCERLQIVLKAIDGFINCWVRCKCGINKNTSPVELLLNCPIPLSLPPSSTSGKLSYPPGSSMSGELWLCRVPVSNQPSNYDVIWRKSEELIKNEIIPSFIKYNGAAERIR